LHGDPSTATPDISLSLSLSDSPILILTITYAIALGIRFLHVILIIIIIFFSRSLGGAHSTASLHFFLFFHPSFAASCTFFAAAAPLPHSLSILFFSIPLSLFLFLFSVLSNAPFSTNTPDRSIMP